MKNSDTFLKFGPAVRCIENKENKQFALINLNRIPLDFYPVFEAGHRTLLQLFDGLTYGDLKAQISYDTLEEDLQYFEENGFFDGLIDPDEFIRHCRKEANESYRSQYDVIMADMEEKIAKQKQNPSIPWSCYPAHPAAAQIEVSVFITDFCNLACVYCHVIDNVDDNRASKTTSFKPKNMSMEIFAAFTTGLFNYIKTRFKTGCAQIVFFGGQPALKGKVRQFMFETADYVCRRAMEEKLFLKLKIDDNGTQIDDEIIEFYKKYNMEISYSFDPPVDVESRQRPFINKRMRSGPIVEMGLKRLLESNTNVGLRATVSNLNHNLILESIKKYMDWGLTAASFIPMQDVTHGKKVKEISAPDPAILGEEYRKTFAYVLEYYEREGKIFEFGPIASMLLSIRNGGKIQTCGMGDVYFAVSTSGDMYSCHRDLIPEIHIAHVHDKDFVDKMMNIDIKKTCPTYLNYLKLDTFCSNSNCSCRKEVATSCGKCNYLPFCGGTCAAASLAHYGCMNHGFSDLVDSDPLLGENRCKWTKQLLNEFFWRYIASDDNSTYRRYIYEIEEKNSSKEYKT